mmetsp:Transcript_37077/g.72934  ORF Transcript_37077/g.72934 Transcript_37077/m.72934 type:complete len:82 (+) Transcript_37077:309-554(+)
MPSLILTLDPTLDASPNSILHKHCLPALLERDEMMRSDENIELSAHLVRSAAEMYTTGEGGGRKGDRIRMSRASRSITSSC